MANQLMDHAPDYAYEHDEAGYNIQPQDVFELAGRMLAYFSGLVD